jgi:hypothetical protein
MHAHDLTLALDTDRRRAAGPAEGRFTTSSSFRPAMDSPSTERMRSPGRRSSEAAGAPSIASTTSV